MKRTGPTPATRALVWARAEGICELCQQSPGEQVHHRTARGSGGTSRPEINSPVNLLLLCAVCHAYIESRRTESYELGLLVRHGNPIAAVRLARGWVRLTAEGGYEEVAQSVTN